MKWPLASIPGKYHWENGNHVLKVASKDFASSIKRIKEEYNFIMLLDICGVDNSQRDGDGDEEGERFESVYHLLNMETHERLRIKTTPGIPSVENLWKVAGWFERESWDMFGIEYMGQSKERLLNHHQFKGHPLRKDYDRQANQPLDDDEGEEDREVSRGREWIDITPSHPAARGTFRIMAELEGEQIKMSKLDIGYVHRCFEKLCEDQRYDQIIPLTNGLNHCSAPMNNIGWCKAIEDLIGVEVPDRAKALRMILAEFSRVADHLLCLGGHAVDLGVSTPWGVCLEGRERICELFEKLSGARQTISIIHIGGFYDDLPLGWATDCHGVIRALRKNIALVDRTLTRSRIWMERTKVCPVSSQDAINWGYTGPCLRACGINYDIRRATPYYFYDDVDFEIPLGINGDCYDRYLVRMEEMRQSLKIVEQALSNLPQGPIRIQDPKVCPPLKEMFTPILKRGPGILS